MDSRVASFLHYYAREGWVHHLQTVCNEVLKQGSSPTLQLWRAYALLASGATAEVRTNKVVQLCTAHFGRLSAAQLLTSAFCPLCRMQSMRELYALQQLPDVGLAATAALLAAHQSAKSVDHDAVIKLSSHLEVTCYTSSLLCL